MAWVQVYDGVDDYSLLDTPCPIDTTDSIKYKFVHHTASGDRFLFSGGIGSDSGRWQVETFNNRLFVRLGTDTSGTIAPDLVDGQTYELELKRTTTTSWEFLVDTVSKWTQTTSFTPEDIDAIGGRAEGAFFAKIDLHYLTANNINLDATGSSHAAGTPILTDLVAANNATGVNMATGGTVANGGVWLDLGGSGISITGATANYNYAGIAGSIDLTGEVIITGSTANYNYTGITATIELGAEIIVTGQTGSYNYVGVDGSVELTGLITVLGQTANYDYDGIAADITLQGSIIVRGSTANYDYNALNATIILQGPITINPKNIVRVKRKSNTIRVKRNSNIIRVR